MAKASELSILEKTISQAKRPAQIRALVSGLIVILMLSLTIGVLVHPEFFRQLKEYVPQDLEDIQRRIADRRDKITELEGTQRALRSAKTDIDEILSILGEEEKAENQEQTKETAKLFRDFIQFIAENGGSVYTPGPVPNLLSVDIASRTAFDTRAPIINVEFYSIALGGINEWIAHVVGDNNRERGPNVRNATIAELSISAKPDTPGPRVDTNFAELQTALRDGNNSGGESWWAQIAAPLIRALTSEQKREVLNRVRKHYLNLGTETNGGFDNLRAAVSSTKDDITAISKKRSNDQFLFYSLVAQRTLFSILLASIAIFFLRSIATDLRFIRQLTLIDLAYKCSAPEFHAEEIRQLFKSFFKEKPADRPTKHKDSAKQKRIDDAEAHLEEIKQAAE